MTAGFLEQEIVYDLAAMIADQGMPIVVRNFTTLPGSPPYPNPPTTLGLTVNGAFGLGVTSINFSGSLVNGRLIAGDSFFLGADPTVYTISAPLNAASNGFTGVAFAPGLVVAATNGESVAFTFSADTTLPALVTSFPSRLINGVTIQASDKLVRFLASGLSFNPTITDKLILFGEVYSIINPRPIQVQGTIFAWACQARK